MGNANCLTLDKLRKEVEPILNDVCIIGGTTICRLVGVAEGEDDYYYIVYTLEQKRIYWSAVGLVFSLKNCIPEDKYQIMDDILCLNECHPVEKMLVITDLDNDQNAVDDCREPSYTRAYSQGVRDAANIVLNLPHTKGWQEITERLSDTDTQALAWRSGNAVLKLLNK